MNERTRERERESESESESERARERERDMCEGAHSIMDETRAIIKEGLAHTLARAYLD